MKVILEFDSPEEHDAYVRTFAAKMMETTGGGIGIRPDPERPVTVASRRKGFSEAEMAFVVDHYATKTVPWIARQLFRKPAHVRNLVQKMRKAGGLPRKYAVRSGDITEEDA